MEMLSPDHIIVSLQIDHPFFGSLVVQNFNGQEIVFLALEILLNGVV